MELTKITPASFYILLIILSAIIAIIYGLIIRSSIIRLDTGTKKMQEIASFIQEGAKAYLNRQYSAIAIVTAISFLILLIIFGLKSGWLFGILISIGFLIGAVFSSIAGYIGMYVAVKTNIRTAQGAKSGLATALDIAFKGGTVTGLLVIGLGLLGVGGYYSITRLFYPEVELAVQPLIGLALGASLVSIFARLGGGIYTKAADIGADLVGKIEAGIPEDDPRNPAVIADNVGDNVGDCAGMASDLIGTYVITAVTSMLLGAILFRTETAVIYPLLLAGVSAIASIIGTLFVKTGKDNKIKKALYSGLAASAVISIVGFFFTTLVFFPENLTTAAATYSPYSLFFASAIGILITALFVFITEYYTSKSFKPVHYIAESSTTGPATNIIAGLTVGFRATVLPVLIVVISIIISYSLAGSYGVSLAAMAMLSMAGIIVALDSFGSITDNAGGIAEMAEMGSEIRYITDQLDTVGNTTKAVTKGYAIGSAGLAAIVIFSSYIQDLKSTAARIPDVPVITDALFSLADPFVLAGLFIGGLTPYIFASFAMSAIGQAGGEVVKEVRRQFKEIPGIMEGKAKPDYASIVDIVTKAAINLMIIPALIPVFTPIILLVIGKFLPTDYPGAKMIGGLLIGSIITGLIISISMTSGGGAWDNAKKYIEEGHLGGKGSSAHQAAITGDTVGDPYKDTAGPAINSMIKILNIIALLLVAFLV